MAGVGHQVGDHRFAPEPGQQHRNHVAHHHQPIGPPGLAPEAQAAAQQIEHLALQQFGHATGKARVAEATGAVAAGVTQHRDCRPPIGLAFPHQRYGGHLGPAPL